MARAEREAFVDDHGGEVGLSMVAQNASSKLPTKTGS